MEQVHFGICELDQLKSADVYGFLVKIHEEPCHVD